MGYHMGHFSYDLLTELLFVGKPSLVSVELSPHRATILHEKLSGLWVFIVPGK